MKHSEAGRPRRPPGSDPPARSATGAEAWLRRVLATSPVVLYTIERRADRFVATWVSESVERVLGYRREETLDPSWWNASQHPDDRAVVAEAAERLRRDGRAVSEYRLRHQDGGYRWIRDEVQRVSGADDDVLEFVGIWQDITERREAEEAAHRKEVYFRSLIGNVLDIITVLDAAGRIVFESASVERALGWRPDELVGRSAFDFVHPDDVARVVAVFQEGVATPDAVVAVEFRFRHKDGSWRILEGVGHNLLHDLVVRGIVFNSRDVTDRKRVEDQLRQAQKLEAVGQLTAGIVHDLNNTLSILLANSELIADALPDDASELHRDLNDIRAAARSGADMVRKLLAFGRRADLHPAAVELRPVLAGVARMLERVLPSAIELEVTFDPMVPRAYADAGAVEQIVVNLATNARDAMPRGGTLRIELVKVTVDSEHVREHDVEPGDYVVVRVRDTGIGMDDATLARIFEPFFTTKPVGVGTGLGMAMVYGLTTQLGGFLDIQSRLGEGTTVEVYLPATSVAAAPPPPAPDAIRGGDETVLVVEDEPALRRTARRILERFGYSVWLATNGEEALRTVAERGDAIDVIVSDQDMPKLDGLALYRELRRAGRSVPFILSTGFDRGRFAEEELGPELRLLQKPWTVEEVARAVRSALDAS